MRGRPLWYTVAVLERLAALSGGTRRFAVPSPQLPNDEPDGHAGKETVRIYVGVAPDLNTKSVYRTVRDREIEFCLEGKVNGGSGHRSMFPHHSDGERSD